MVLQSIKDVEEALRRFVPKTISMRTDTYQLDRIQAFLSVLGNPQNSYRVVHVAGTSGKTSTAYFIQALLVLSGNKTGLTISPHVTSLTERVQINGRPVANDAFVAAFTEFLGFVETSPISLTYFEVLVAFAYWYFRHVGVDYAVVETGLGGLLDGTNVVSRADKVCVISDIGYDHTEILGETLPEIAAQKAGIIHHGNAVITVEQAPVVVDVIKAEVERRSANLMVVAPTEGNPDTSSLPLFQQRNWILADAAYAYLRERDSLTNLDERQIGIARHTQPPGRMETVILADGRQLILDGAHNPQKLGALGDALRAKGIQHAVVLANLVAAPEHKLRSSLQQLRPIATRLIVPAFVGFQDLNRRSVDPREIRRLATDVGIDSVMVAETVADGLAMLRQRPEHTLLVTGSFYLVGSVRAILVDEGYDL
jgi:dihydrofolate synthase/folylpolyglutamate synthase